MPLSLELKTPVGDDGRSFRRGRELPIRVEQTGLTPDMLRTMLRAQLPYQPAPGSSTPTSIQFAPATHSFSADAADEHLLPLRSSRVHDGGEKRNRWEQAWECGQWLLLFLAIAFVTVVVVMLGVVLHHVQSMVDQVGGDTLSDKLDTVMMHAINAARNAEIVSNDAVSMSTLARSAAQEAHPKIIGALNESQQLMHDLRDFSSHPAVTLTAGHGR